MGFYGNITNTSKTQFQFDKTYPNRAAMDSSVNGDGVFIGRYVLVEYESLEKANFIRTAYLGADGRFYKTSEQIYSDLLRFSDLDEGNDAIGYYIIVPIENNLRDDFPTQDLIYQVIGFDNVTIEDKVYLLPAVVEKEEIEGTYYKNYQIDIEKYGASRGYDSTVWQKVFDNGNEKYVMIAELNTVVPTFGITVDAPTQSPTVPHFDTDSSNIYYKLHVQPSWGLRVKSAAKDIQGRMLNQHGEEVSGFTALSTIEKSSLPTDETVNWKRSNYNTKTGETSNQVFYLGSKNEQTGEYRGQWIEDNGELNENNEIPAAIYYNKAGFNSDVSAHYKGDIKDSISIAPTGKTGMPYNEHNGIFQAQEDTQEISIMLPSLGNSIAEMWDLIYGNEDINTSETRNKKIEWEEASTIQSNGGLRLVDYDSTGFIYHPTEANTLAGAINSAHDIMGMIISKQNASVNDLNDETIKNLNKNFIYYFEKDKKFYRKKKTKVFQNEAITDIANYNAYQKVDLSDWNNNDENYYYKEVIAGREDKPNYIKENVYYDDKLYYSVGNLTEEISLGDKFEPYKYFHYLRNQSIQIEGSPYVSARVYQTSTDTEYIKEHSYTQVNTKSYFAKDARFFIADKYWKATFKKVDTPTEAGFEDGDYFIKDTVNNKYRRPYATEEYAPNNVDYYSVDEFEKAKSYESSAQYFDINIEVREDEKKYVLVYKYEPIDLTDETFIAGIYYTQVAGKGYVVANTYEKNVQYFDRIETWKEQTSTELTIKDASEIFLVNWVVNKYYLYQSVSSNGYPRYCLLSQSAAEGITDYSNVVIVEISTDSVDKFYTPNTYYYKVTDTNSPYNGSYVIDTSSDKTEDRIYYNAISSISDPIVLNTYEQNKYYYLLGGNYILDNSLVMNANRDYYIKNSLYVYEDTSEKFLQGAEWNLNIINIPEGIELRAQNEVWTLEEIPGFAKNYNTMNGIILRINEILERNDALSRDVNTVQGCINKLQDIIKNFNNLSAHKILISNSIGQIQDVDIERNEWIETLIDNNKVSILHKESDLAAGSYGTETSNLSNGGAFNIPSFTTDEAGHIIGYKIDGATVTIPELKVSTNGEGNIISNISFNNDEFSIINDAVYVDNLPLSQYIESVTGNNYFTNTDSISDAFGITNDLFNKVDTNIKTINENIETNRNDIATINETTIPTVNESIINLETTLTNGLNTTNERINSLTIDTIGGENLIISSIKQDSGLLSATASPIGILNITYNTNVTEPLAEALTNIVTSIDNSNSNTNAAFEALKMDTLAIENGEIISSISQTNGLITASKRALTSEDIPELSANKITSEIFAADRIPVLDINSKTEGVLDIERIPSLSADKITTNVFDIARIPNLTPNKIVQGEEGNSQFDSNLIPQLNFEEKIIFSDGYTLNENLIPNISSNKLIGAISNDLIPDLDGGKIITLNNYEVDEAENSNKVLATDTLINAIKKLENRIKTLEEALEINHPTVEVEPEPEI